MPNRIIKESICTSEEIASISPEAEVLFYRLIVKADDFGLFHGNPKIIIGNCFPLSSPKESKVQSWLDELCRAGLIVMYIADDGKKYLKLLSWDKHQQRRATKSKFPHPVLSDITCEQMKSDDITCEQIKSDTIPSDDINCNQLYADDITCNQMSANVPVNVNENENVNEERKTRTSANGAQVADGFNRFWEVYPKRVGKKDAIKAWGQIKPDEAMVQAIIEGVERWKASEQWTKDGGQFIPYPATFLRGERWNDECQPAITKKAPAEKNYDDDEDFLKG